jgi:hypothetical protein
MKHFIFFCTLFFWSIGYAQNGLPKTAVQDFFKAFHKQDTSTMRSFFHVSASIQTVTSNVDGPVVREEFVNELIRGIVRIPNEIRFEERIKRFKVRSDGKIAQVWTPYEFWINGKKSHSGVNSFVLVKVGDDWKIIHLIDTRKK